MSAIQRLYKALEDREKQTGKFFFDIMNEIDLMIDDLSLCDRSTSSPEVSDSVNLSIQELEKLIEKIKDYSNIDKNVSDGIVEAFDKKVKDNQLTRIAAPSFWQRLFGPKRAAPAPVQATPVPSQSLADRLLGLRPSDRTDRSRAQWNGYAEHPDSVPNIPNATPVYQAEAYYENENPYRYKGGRKRTRKSHRKI